MMICGRVRSGEFSVSTSVSGGLPILNPHLDKKSLDEGFLAGTHDADRGNDRG
jgi:hypothetical protein